MEDKNALFICKCRGEVSNFINLDKLEKEFKNHENIAFTHLSNSLCDAVERQNIHNLLRDEKPDGLILAGCSPRYYEQYFRSLATKAGMNAGKVTFANIREQVAWVHKEQPVELISNKAKTAIEVAIDTLRNTENFIATKVNISKSVVIIGAGIGGLQTALSIARTMNDVTIHLIEKEAFIGGPQLKYSKAFPRDECSACAISPLISELSTYENVIIHDKTEVETCVGRVGDYRVGIVKKPRYVTDDCIACGKCEEVCPKVIIQDLVEVHKAVYLPFKGSIPIKYNIDEANWGYCISECSQPCLKACPVDAINLEMMREETVINAGIVVIATGADVGYPSREDNPYGYGEIDDVLTLHQYEKLLATNSRWKGEVKLMSDETKAPKSIAFILCVDRGTLGYCSKYCCLSTAAAIRQTIEKLPNVKIYVFYQDQFADSKYGDDYIKSTKKFTNVQWIRSIPRQINNDERITVSVPVSGGQLEVDIDLLILATGLKPPKKTPFLRHIFGLDASREGFFSEFDLLFSPVSTLDVGKFVIGTSSGPKTIPETTISAYAAAAQINNLLNREVLELPISITEVNKDLCSGCGTCIKTCPYHANSINLDENVAVVDISRCRGCGNCVTSCPAKARDLIEFSDKAILGAIDLLGDQMIRSGEVSMLGFLCNGCGYSTADNVGLSGAGLRYSPNFSVIRVPCSGRVDARHMLHALTKFDGVLIGACKIHSCQYSVGNFDAQKRVFLLKGTLQAANINPVRLMIEYFSPTEVEKFTETVNTFEKNLIEGKYGKKIIVGGMSHD
ncbi:MAG: hydrogenase iron-sulfur subunit [Candidatus Heimdallarchaeota archaeon]|nr:hydrogenase iron-sulfur subunit [Candidatus Heimdallarchaeota archaeon]